MKGLGDIMKQAQEMQQKAQKIQDEIASAEVNGEAGAGLVKVVMTGRYDVKSIDIDPTEGPDKLSERVLNEVEHVIYPRAIWLFTARKLGLLKE